MDTSLLQTVCFVPGERKPTVTFSLNLSHLMRTISMGFMVLPPTNRFAYILFTNVLGHFAYVLGHFAYKKSVISCFGNVW